MANYERVQISGLLPGLDTKQPNDLFCADGKNFLIDAQGPYAAFGSKFAAYAQVYNPRNLYAFEVGGDIFILTEKEVIKYDQSSQLFVPILSFTLTNSDPYPWSVALVGGIYYFARKGSSVLSYTVTTEIWKTITNNVPNNPHAVTQSNGRLVILGEQIVAWSAISNGEDLAPNADKGVGVQSLALIGFGDPLGVYEIGQGFVTYTSEGVMLSESVQTQFSYRHQQLQSEHVPLGPFAIASVGKFRHVMLTSRGLFQVSGLQPEEFQPLFNEYLRRQLFPVLDLNLPEIARVTFDNDRELLFISLGANEEPFIYTEAWVYYFPTEQWGKFNRTHLAFGAVNLLENTIYNLGYVCPDGCLHQFEPFPQVEQAPDRSEYYHYHSVTDYPARYEDGGIVFPTLMTVTGFDENPFTPNSGLYLNYDPYTPYIPELGPIDSFVKIGTFKMPDENVVDTYNLITDIVIGTATQVDGQEFVDWQAIVSDIFEDWEIATGNEDWGDGVFSSVSYTAKLIGTMDGENAYAAQDLELISRALAANTTLVGYFDAGLTYGKYYFLTISAELIGESYHIKMLAANPKVIGRL